MQVKLSKRAEKYYLSQDSITRQRLKRGLKGLEDEPFTGDIVPMHGIPNTYRLRVGKYRILFSVDDDTVIATNIDSRGQVYK